MALTDNLIAYWKLDESSGNAADATGNGHTLTNNGTLTYGPAVINNGAITSTTGPKYLSAVDAGLQISSGDISIQAWAKTTATAAAIVQRRYTTGGDWINYTLYFDGSKFSWYETSNTTGDYGQWQSTATLATLGLNNGNFHHIVFVATFGNNASHLLYVDGVNQGGSFVLSTSKTGINQVSARFGIGDPFTATFDGTVDEVGLWNRILSSSEVTSLYNGGAGLAYPFSTGAVVHNLSLVGVGT